jgi:hypothetical protein
VIGTNGCRDSLREAAHRIDLLVEAQIEVDPSFGDTIKLQQSGLHLSGVGPREER